ncbi:MAG: sulfoxide reductase heme-binding subunit YedZ [Gammaproteobacteria bacterium]|nr:sulfoxide reductase heme-binding subunit YedZ [Gammaproteobacteria bacterium]
MSKVAVFFAALVPAIMLGVSAWRADLGPNPVETLTHVTGEWGLRFLIATLALSPLRKLFGWTSVLKFRRMLGLFAFFYTTMHLSTYLVLDQFFAWEDIVADIIKRPYITIGFAAFLCMLPLALTSTRFAMIKLGKRWRQLHRLSYVAGILGVAHFLWLVRADSREPLIYAAILLVLLLMRIPRKRSARPSRTTQQPTTT